MGFTKKTWKNRIAEYINRRLITMEDGSTSLVTVARDEGTISQEGDAFNAANMNDLEDRIESEFNEINQSLTYEKEVYIGAINSWAGNYFHNFSYSDYGIDNSIVDVIAATFINYTYVGTLGILIGENKEQFYISCSNPKNTAEKVIVKFCLRNKS